MRPAAAYVAAMPRACSRLTGRSSRTAAGLMANCRFWILDESGASTRGNCFHDRDEQRRPILPNHIEAEMRRTVVMPSLRFAKTSTLRAGVIITQQALFSSKCRHPSIYASRPSRHPRPLDARNGDQENGSISQRHDLRLEPNRLSFSFLALSYPIPSSVVGVCSSPLLVEREAANGFSSKAERIGSQSVRRP